MELLRFLHIYPINLSIQILLNIYLKYIHNTEYKNLWFNAFCKIINIIKGNTYFPKNHPLLIIKYFDDDTYFGLINVLLVLTPKYIRL